MSLLVFISHENLTLKGEQAKKELLPHTQQLISKLVGTGNGCYVSCDENIDADSLGKLGTTSFISIYLLNI